jgi:hypothetical protein
MCSVKSPLFKHFIHLAKNPDFGIHFSGQFPRQGTSAQPSQTTVPHRPPKISFKMKIKQFIFNNLQKTKRAQPTLFCLKR